MHKPQFYPIKNDYDPRWFIWTIVFLLTSGTALVSFIVISDINSAENVSVVSSHSKQIKPANK